MYQILEVAPGIVFVASYFVISHFFPEVQPIYWATGLFMIALVVQFMICLLFKLKISKLMWVVLVVGITAGAITIVFQAPIIIKWRPTVISWAMCAAFLMTHVFGRKNILKWLLEDYVQLSDRLWNYQTLVFGIVFLLSGTTNISGCVLVFRGNLGVLQVFVVVCLASALRHLIGYCFLGRKQTNRRRDL